MIRSFLSKSYPGAWVLTNPRLALEMLIVLICVVLLVVSWGMHLRNKVLKSDVTIAERALSQERETTASLRATIGDWHDYVVKINTLRAASESRALTAEDKFRRLKREDPTVFTWANTPLPRSLQQDGDGKARTTP